MQQIYITAYGLVYQCKSVMLFLTSCLHFLLSNLDCMAMVEGTDSDNLIKQMATAMSTFLASENKWVGMKDKPFPESKKPFKNTRLQHVW